MANFFCLGTYFGKYFGDQLRTNKLLEGDHGLADLGC
jgi:hypothetical protein